MEAMPDETHRRDALQTADSAGKDDLNSFLQESRSFPTRLSVSEAFMAL